MSTLAGLSVALVILADIATGQGPAALNNYLAVIGGPDYRGGPPLGPLPPPPQPMIVYPPRADYDLGKSGKEEKEYEKEKEKEKDKPEAYGKPGYGSAYPEKSTPAPGVLTSFSNTMSDAWKSFTTLGRQTRDAREKRSVDTADASDEASQTESSQTGQSSARSMDEFEWKQFHNQGTIYLRIPKALVCYNSYAPY